MTPSPSPNHDDVIRAVLIEDDERLARLTARYLESHGVVVSWIADGREGLAEVLRSRPNIVLLDLMLPGMDGLAVCRELRARVDVPIIILTAREEEADRVLGLELGADDYLTKPFSSRELLARMRAQVRRARGRAGPSAERLDAGRLVLETATLKATLDGQTLALTTLEFALLRVFAENLGRVLTREQLLFLSRGSADESFDRSIDVHISRLRSKLGDDSRNPRLLKTVRGLGYVLVSE
jgi:two-component system, OmpR family, response regulator